jgi:glutamate synthase domain-containing protein 1
MCGIVGLFAKHPVVEERLGAYLGAMLVQLANRGPDSAGVAVYRGGRMEIFKEVGDPRGFVERFDLASMSGSHGLGHTRMATESRVTTAGAHPFSTGLEVCLVHNGSLSNHNALRRMLRHEGIGFQTENDTEVAAGYLEWRLREGDTLRAALEACLVDLDGFYTFAVGTADGFAVLRDPIACKPAVMAETDDWVAMASEYRAIAVLPGAEDAAQWEPEPGRVYSWEREPV